MGLAAALHDRIAGLPGLAFPGDPNAFPTKDEVADYLEEYARRMQAACAPEHDSPDAPVSPR